MWQPNTHKSSIIYRAGQYQCLLQAGRQRVPFSYLWTDQARSAMMEGRREG